MNFKLHVLRGQPQGKKLTFPNGEFLIGRGEECHIRPNSPWVSRQHCILRVADSEVALHDLGSTNGTLINGSRVIGAQVLRDRDNIQIGPLVFEALYEPDVMQTEEARVDTAVVGMDTSSELPAVDVTLPDKILPKTIRTDTKS